MTRESGGEKPRIRADRPARAAFFGALIWGLAAQGMGLFNKFSWHDDIFQLFGTGNTITSGRWMLYVLERAETLIFGGHCSLPLFNGFLALVFVGATAALATVLLRIRRPVYGALLGAAMASFPMITSLFGFMFAAPAYLLALLMIMASAYLICEDGRWPARAAGIVLGACSVGAADDDGALRPPGAGGRGKAPLRSLA